ncbi:hypothetical protein [Desulfosarcina ovata]|uniref:Alginate export domain-containing protein n=1 Tax=Desulfosarcina ovata subsp. ovata TaxID=2752305 RepID=A0A5K8AL62_9BACT|nr:hypothetical protein [Desulfosarcina ovata]BBO93455.1 hypothetical protein DSCOOX_66350 [Desulfosarcina ovata subsp. ovata]
MKTRIATTMKTPFFWISLLAMCILLASSGMAMEFEAGDAGKMTISGKAQAAFGGTQYLDFVDNNSKGDDADFDATREISLKFTWEYDPQLKTVLSFQIGEGSTGGYFGSTDALVGGEEDGDLILELDNLYIDYTTDFGLNLKLGSQSYNLSEIAYGSHIMYEVPAGVTASYPINERTSISAGWFRFADLMDDTDHNTSDQADFLFAKLGADLGGFKLTPWIAFANIQEDVVKYEVEDGDTVNNYTRYAYFDYPTLIGETNGLGIGDANPTDAVTAYYLGLKLDFNPSDLLSIQASGTYGDMDWETATEDITIAGYFFDLVVDYNAGFATPEFFAFYGNGPDDNDNDIDMMPVLIGGPTYTSSYFGGSRYNDNMFDSYDSTYATSMWAVGFKLKDIKTAEWASHEFQFMYAEGLADDSIFEAPDDILLNDDESLMEFNFNSTFQLRKHLVFATELGYIIFDEDSDYDEAANGSVEDMWKVACSFEFTF